MILKLIIPSRKGLCAPDKVIQPVFNDAFFVCLASELDVVRSMETMIKTTFGEKARTEGV